MEAILLAGIDSMQDGVVITNTDQQIMYVNESVLRMTGYTKEEVIGQTPKLFQSALTTPRLKDSIRETLASGDVFIGTTINQRKNGSTYYVELYISPIRSDGEIVGYIGTQRDIAYREKTRMESFFDIPTHLLIILDVDGGIFVNTLNASAEMYFGLNLHGDVGKSILQLNMGSFTDHAMRCAETASVVMFEQVIITGDGNRVVEFTLSPVTRHTGEVIGINCVGSDITDSKKASEHIHYLAYHDSLTDLPNRVLFGSRIKEEVEHTNKSGEKLAVLFIDLDKFKAINDNYGHGVGDRLLAAVARRLIRCVRDTDLVARLGGDEFAIIVSGCKMNDAVTAATSLSQRIIDQIALPFEVGGQILNVGISIGIAAYPDHASDIDTLIRRADFAMYHAKRIEGDSFTVYDDNFTNCPKDCENCDLVNQCFADREPFIVLR